jgi:hypothetical protein
LLQGANCFTYHAAPGFKLMLQFPFTGEAFSGNNFIAQNSRLDLERNILTRASNLSRVKQVFPLHKPPPVNGITNYE